LHLPDLALFLRRPVPLLADCRRREAAMIEAEPSGGKQKLRRKTDKPEKTALSGAPSHLNMI